MATVYIPPQLRTLTSGCDHLEIEAQTVRQLIAGLEQKFPGLAARLTAEDRLQPGLAVSIDGELTNQGLFARLSPNSEVHFLPALGGG